MSSLEGQAIIEHGRVEESVIFDSSDPKAVKAKIKSVKEKEATCAEALRGVMSTEPGRMWMHSLLVKCRPFTSSFASDPLLMAHNCGETNIGLQLIAELHSCSPELYLQMMKENSDG